MRFAVLALGIVACAPRGAESPLAAREGIAIAVYTQGERGYAVVDDRRTVEVRGGVLALDRLAPDATLSSLVIEPLAGSDLVVGACARESIAGAGATTTVVLPPPFEPAVSLPVSPVVRCAVTGRGGAHRVRVLYVAPTLRFAAQHAIAVAAADRAAVATRFVLPTPALGARADVVLYQGLPGSDTPPVEVARGAAHLDGAVALFGGAPREVPARVRRVWHNVDVATDQAVRVWLELQGELPAGRVTAELALPTEPAALVTVEAAELDIARKQTRIPLYSDRALRPIQARRLLRPTAAGARELYTIAISNAGTVAREVFVVSHLRERGAHTVEAAWPAAPRLAQDRAHAKLAVAPGGVARMRFTIATATATGP